ncbi:MAG: hypothetical protein KAG14_01460 [Mycoplasmataceae bacterium]|nr:hypothetical protein [Mycoplasmataceae bacterium]
MRKIGPILAIISGISAIVMATLGLLVASGTIDSTELIATVNKQQLNRANGDISINTLYYISIGVGALMLLMGGLAFSNSRGIASFLLLALFALSFGLGVWVGIKQDSFPTTTIVSLSITGVATLGLAIGFFAPK